MNIRVIIIDLKLFLCSDDVVVDDAAAIGFILFCTFIRWNNLKKKKNLPFLVEHKQQHILFATLFSYFGIFFCWSFSMFQYGASDYKFCKGTFEIFLFFFLLVHFNRIKVIFFSGKYGIWIFDYVSVFFAFRMNEKKWILIIIQ